MRKPSPQAFAIGGFALLFAAVVTPAAAQTIDPALAKPWAYTQQAMPGVPYDLVKAACAEGALTIYTGTWTDAQQNQIDHFKDHYPCVKVQMFVLQTGARRERFLTEERAGRYIDDIVQDSDPGVLDKQSAEGLVMNYTVTSDSFYADAVKKKGYWYPLKNSLVANVWNTNLVTDEQAKKLAEWKGVTDPIWKGKVGVADAAGGGTLMLPYYAWQKMYGDDFVKAVGAQKPRVFTSTDLAAAALASGDIAVMFAAAETSLPPLWEAGAPMRWVFPSPGIGAVAGQGVAAHAPHPSAAKLYQEFSFSNEGYGYWQTLSGPPARNGYKDERKVAAQPWYQLPKDVFAYDTADATNSTPAVVDMFHKVVGSAH